MGRIWTRPRTPLAAQSLRKAVKQRRIFTLQKGDPLFRGLAYAWLFQGTTGRDIVASQAFTSFQAYLKIGPNGRYLNFFNGYVDTGISSADFQPKDITITARVRVNSGATDAVLACNNYNGSTVPFLLGLYHSSVQLRGMAYYTSGWKRSGYNTDIRGTGWHIVSGVHRGQESPNDFYFIDGKLDASAGNPFADLPTHSGTYYNLRIGNYQANNDFFNGDIDFVLIHDRGLNFDEVAELHERYYRGFEPPNDRIFIYSEAAPPTGRIMSSLTGAGGLVGEGGIAGSGGGLAG